MSTSDALKALDDIPPGSLNLTPTARAVEQAREIKLTGCQLFCSDAHPCPEHLAAARALDSVRQEQLERDCKAVCEYCAKGFELTMTDDDCFHTVEEERMLPRFPNCDAASIRAAALRAGEERG